MMMHLTHSANVPSSGKYTEVINSSATVKSPV